MLHERERDGTGNLEQFQKIQRKQDERGKEFRVETKEIG